MTFLHLTLLAVLCLHGVISNGMVDREESQIILTAHGMSMNDANRVVIKVHDGIVPNLPCVMKNAGTHEHGDTFTKENFHYKCNNGTAEVIACVANDKSVIQLGRVFIQNGIRHKCDVVGDSVSYQQESMCFENGINYNVGDSFRNGTFRLTCTREGINIEGCYIQNSFDQFIVSGESRIIGQNRHECSLLPDGRVRYQVKVIGCTHQGQQYSTGQVWTEGHVRYRCQTDGTLTVLGCIDEMLFLDLGRDLLTDGYVHRCYQTDNTAYYHKFSCPFGSLQECIAVNPAMRSRRYRRV